MKNSTAKLVTIGGISLMGFVSGTILALPVVLFSTGLILLQKDKTPHERLVEEIKRSFKMDGIQAEDYAKELERKALNEYTVTKEK